MELTKRFRTRRQGPITQAPLAWRSHFTADNVIVLAAIPIAGPLGAGLVGASMAMFARRRIAARRRLFNAAMTASAAMTGGLGYALAGGTFELEGTRGAGFLIAHVGFPIVVADLFNLGLNALLLAGVLRASLTRTAAGRYTSTMSR